MKKILSCRIFWTLEVGYAGDGLWYHYWTNWIDNFTIPVFAGYSKNDHRRKSTTFKEARERFLNPW